MANRCWAIIPAAGSGQRMQTQQAKQYLRIAGKTILEHSLAAILAETRVTKVVISLSKNDNSWSELALADNVKIITTSGGQSRAQSVYNGLVELLNQAEQDDWVLVHDAARPCLQAADLSSLIEHCFRTGRGAILATPVVDTLKRVNSDGAITATVSREHMYQAQTPQMFRLGELKLALQSALEQGGEVTDEASAMELAAKRVDVVNADAHNIKVTTPADLQIAEFLLQDKRSTIDLS